MSGLLRTVLGRSWLYSQRQVPVNALAIRCVHHHLERDDFERFIGMKRSNPQKANRNTHINEKKWRRARGRKNIPVVLPDEEFEKNRDSMNPTDVRKALLRQGFNPAKEVLSRSWNTDISSEQQLTIQSFGGIVESYIPPENPLSLLPSSTKIKSHTTAKFGETYDRVLNRWKNYFGGTRRIKKKEGFRKFDLKEFCVEAQNIYVKAYNALAERNNKALIGLITEHAYTKMWPDVETGTLVWKDCEFISPSKVVSVRCGDQPYKSGNDIAQITVRMHTKQTYALYDRFGHLLLGSPTEPKECIEYVVFENHIARLDSVWRLNDKIYPEWTEPKDGITRPTLIAMLPAEERPEKTIPLKASSADRIKREEEKKKKEAEEAKE